MRDQEDHVIQGAPVPVEGDPSRVIDGHPAAIVQVCGLEQYRHAAVGNGRIDAVVVERIAGFE